MKGLVFLWIMFYFSHSFLAAGAVKEFMQGVLGRAYIYYRLAYNIIAIGLFVFILFTWKKLLPEDSLMFDLGGIGILSGTILGVSGLALGAFAFRQYDLEEFLGLDAFTGKRISHGALVTGGLHNYVRHPLYSGILLLIVGLCLIFPLKSVLVSAGVTCVYLPIGIYLEEQKLLAVFGAGYRQYMDRTKRLIPFIY